MSEGRSEKCSPATCNQCCIVEKMQQNRRFTRPDPVKVRGNPVGGLKLFDVQIDCQSLDLDFIQRETSVKCGQ